MGDMTMQAAGAYLRVLRDEERLSQTAVAQQIGVDIKTIQRVEGGEGRVLAPTIAAFTAIVQGSADHIQQLILSPDKTSADGEALAHAWLSERQQKELATAARPLTAEQTQDALKRLADLIRDPAKLARFLREYDSGTT
jgi:transcriptional regulator with XRE-family HTH domain